MKTKNKWLFDVLEVAISVMVITYFIMHFVLISVQVDGNSMYPTLHDGDFGYSFIITKNLGVKRFDIVVIDIAEDNDKLLVKRVIGLPGEKVTICEGKVYINDEILEDVVDIAINYEGDEVVLGEDEYYVLGDNRNDSIDSRVYGKINKSQFVSSHVLVISPFSHFGVY